MDLSAAKKKEVPSRAHIPLQKHLMQRVPYKKHADITGPTVKISRKY